MKKFLSILLILFVSGELLKAQDTIVISDTLAGWDSSWRAGLSGSQASYSNWSQGGVSNVAVTGNSLIKFKYRDNRFSYGFLIDTRYGQTRIENEGVRKIDDRLVIRNRFLYDLADENADFKLFGNINLRTQFDEGFNYGAGPDGGNILISDIFSPAYITESVGLAYVPTINFSFEAGFGMQQTIVLNEELSTRYNLPEGDTFKNEAGITTAASYTMSLAENLTVDTSLETFTSLNKKIRSTNVYFSNRFTGRINRFMNANLSLDFVYDDDFSKELQIAQVLSVGVSFSLL